tara:strand:+ start:15045 stop:15302 length:258 start_codon:yes stop_codon:yes gene_type:complete
MNPNENCFTNLLCSLDHRPKTFRARRFYFRVQRFICRRNIENGWTSQADICNDIFSDDEIVRIARVMSKIRIMDADIRHRLGKLP